jgi:hypothetical protein
MTRLKGKHMIEKGQHVIYHDPIGKPRPAVVTNVFGSGETPSINVVFVNDDEKQTDNYGQKIERSTSVPHKNQQFAHGNYWLPVS